MSTDDKQSKAHELESIFDGLLRSLTQRSELSTPDAQRLLFPNGINYIELKIDVCSMAGVTLVVSGDPQKQSGHSAIQPTTPAGIAYDPEVDPDAPLPLLEPPGLTDLPWRVANSLKLLLSQMNAHYAHRSTASDGTIGDYQHCHGGNPKTSDHCAWIVDGDHRVVSAIDITHDPQHHCDAGKVATGLVESRDDRIKYVIWNRRIAASYAVGSCAPWTWRTYTGPSPHTDHVHLSVLAEKDKYDSEAPWADQVFS